MHDTMSYTHARGGEAARRCGGGMDHGPPAPPPPMSIPNSHTAVNFLTYKV